MDEIIDSARDDIGAQRDTKCAEEGASVGYGDVGFHGHGQSQSQLMRAAW